ncbi:MAG: hypothetical protein B7Z37_29860 [Verrucomicrobia bacterium 12-59-8]|nr:MAG: hypothetical protein B7Z37_29860 [Verrucomicrobia bacterium 12-59-8]
MNSNEIPESLVSIWGTDTPILLGLTEKEAMVIDLGTGQTHSFRFPAVSEAFTPVGDFSAKHDVFVTASAPGVVTAIQASNHKQLWQVVQKGLISDVCVIDASKDVVLSGRTTRVLRLEDGALVDSPLSNYHSQMKAGRGCICVKNRTQESYYFDHSSKPGLFMKSPFTSLKAAISTPHFIAIVGIESAGKVIFLDPVFGTEAGKALIPNCNLIDTITYDSKRDCLLAASHSTSKRIEVWELSITGKQQRLAVLPEGVGRVGWSFRLDGTQLVSPGGRLADLTSGELLRHTWGDWGLK